MRYFVTFYHFTSYYGYGTGTILSFNEENNFMDVNFIKTHLSEKYKDKLVSEVKIQEIVEITESEFIRLNNLTEYSK